MKKGNIFGACLVKRTVRTNFELKIHIWSAYFIRVKKDARNYYLE